MKKFYLLLFSLSWLLINNSFAQTAIDPNAGGSFDDGNSFAANGWTVVNSSANKWVVGSQTFKSAPNSAYISADGNVNNYSYDNSTIHISHFYKKVTLPANAINVSLSFQLLGNVEFDWGNFQELDGLEIYADPSLTVPVADARPGGSAIQEFMQFNQNSTYIGQTQNLNPLAGQTFYLIFTWVNDGDGIGSGPPASVDQISLTYCIQSIPYDVTGGGGFCIGSAGANVGLAGSVVGIDYQLYVDGNPVGSPVAGTGNPLDFGPQNVVGNYTVIGTSGHCTNVMPGSVDVVENPLPTPTAGSNSPQCFGSTLNLTSAGGTSYSWVGPNSFNSALQSPSITNVTTASTGTYTVTITDANGCVADASTDIVINPGNTSTLTSGYGTDAQAICVNTPITDITYSTTGATGATFSGLPAGVTGSWTGDVITISGTPTATGIFNYSATLTGGCSITVNGTITVTSSNTITLTSATNTDAQSTCTSAPITDITYSTAGATGASVSGLPQGISGSWVSNVFTITGTPTEVGTFNYTVTTTGGCGSATATGTIYVSLPSGGSISSISVCDGGSGTLTLSGYAGNIVQWEYCSDTTSASWTVISNTTSSQGFSGLTAPAFYRALVGNSCGNVYSSIGTVQIHNYWIGGDASNPADWNTAANWSDNQVPSTSCDNVYIPATINDPVLSSAPVATITNLHILSGATVTINGNGKMQLGGTISNDGTLDITNGTLELNGSSGTQNIEGNLFKDNTVKNLIISNNVNIAGSSNDTLNITGTLSFGASTAELITGDNITLKSSPVATANVGILGAGDVITGKVTVERYINTGTGGHGKSWQLLATPTTGGQTIKDSWQEGASATNISTAGVPYSAGNLHPGYGTMITSAVAGAANQLTPGFDAYTSPGPSMKTYVSATDNYDAGPSSTADPLYNQKGYMILVRGDRSVYTSSGAATPTILRSTGTLFTPALPPPTTNVLADKFESVGNPYASAIDMHNITLGGKVNDLFIVWDPKLTGLYGLGAFQYLSKTGGPTDDNYYALPGGGSYGNGPVNAIQSGQAFLVETTGGTGTVGFSENAKTDGSTTVLRAQNSTGKNFQLRAILYGDKQ